MSFVRISRRNEATKKSELSISDHFRPIIPGRGAKRIGPTSPPIGRILPIQESCSDVGMKSKGESDKSFVIFAIAGDDQLSMFTFVSITIKLSQSNLPNRCSPWYSNDIRYEIITRCQLVYHLSNSSPTIAAKYSLNLFSRFRTGPISGCLSPLSKGRLNDIPLNLIADSLILGFNFLLVARNSIIAGQAKLDNKHKTTITTKTSRNFFRSFLFCLLINDKGNAFAWRWSEHLGNP